MNIHLGFELKTGHPVAIPLRHTAVIGLTQESGKTTTLEALITRSNLRALAFVTKRGEGSFSTGRIVSPYFADPAQDSTQPLWDYVSSLLETTIKEKLKLQRSTIMKVCDVSADRKMSWPKPKTLAQVAENIELAMQHVRNGFEQSMLLQLREYFRIVTPQIEALPKAAGLDLQTGLNIMYLEKQPAQMQALIIASCLNWIRTREKNTVTVVPESWKFMGEGRSSPAMAAAEQLIREGGVLSNFLWIDSQDLVGIATPIRKQIGVWILGRQGEINEAERTVKHLPTESRKPKPADVQTLRKGEFYVSWGEALKKVYVQPAWMDTAKAQLVALTESPAPPRPKSDQGDDEMWREQAERLERELEALRKNIADQEAKFNQETEELRKSIVLKTSVIADLQKQMTQRDVAGRPSGYAGGYERESSANGPDPIPQPVFKALDYDKFDPADIKAAESWYERLWPLVRESILKDARVLEILQSAPEIIIATKAKRVMLDGDTLRGRLALLISEGFFDGGKRLFDAYAELRKRGQTTAGANLSRELRALTSMGFLIAEGNTNQTAYRRVPTVKVSTQELTAVQ